MTHDSAAKTYVLNLGEALHHELAPAGVDVTVVMPGSVDTPIIDALGLRRAALPIRPQPAEAAVRETVTAFLKHRPLHIPGRLMRIMTRLTPRSLSVRMNSRCWAMPPATWPSGRRPPLGGQPVPRFLRLTALKDYRRHGVLSFSRPGLFVSDASIFPGHAGLNPMETVIAVATRTDRHLIERRAERGICGLASHNGYLHKSEVFALTPWHRGSPDRQ